MYLQLISVYMLVKEFIIRLLCMLFKYPTSKSYLIIGCSSGIGKSLCVQLVEQESDISIVLSSRKKNQLNVLKSELLSINPNAKIHVRPFDVTHFNDARQLFFDAHKLIGKIDTVIINSGVFDLHNLEDSDYFNKSLFMLNTNLYGPIAVVSEFAFYLNSNAVSNPYVVVVSSISSNQPFYNSTTYSTSKQCLEDFIIRSSIQLPLVDFTIIKPGYVMTNLTNWTKSVPLAISSSLAAFDIKLSMKIRQPVATVPAMPWRIIMPLTHYVPLFIINKLIKHEFDLNTFNNQTGVIKLRNHIYNKPSYALLEEIGRGSYGTVYKAVDDSGKMVAIKQVIMDDVDILKEIELMKSFANEYVIELYESYTFDGKLHIVMEYCPSGSIADILLDLYNLQEQQIQCVLRDALRGLHYLHSMKAIHRDIKAGNLLVGHDGTVKLGDFGVSATVSNSVKRQTVIGTPYWMAPEVINETGYNTSADIWSLGITAIECADGKPPYNNIHPMRVIFMIPNRPPPTLKDPSNFSIECIDFISMCLVKNPSDRPTAGELLHHEFIKTAPIANVLVDMANKSIDIRNKKDKAIEERGLRSRKVSLDIGTVTKLEGSSNSNSLAELNATMVVNADTTDRGNKFI
eukprot:NODE_46_length_27655_cov_0.671796.p4 type:complete len:629 gc:universal NODE_46_length_27655_cov_0.671796:5026-3140(-)